MEPRRKGDGRRGEGPTPGSVCLLMGYTLGGPLRNTSVTETGPVSRNTPTGTGAGSGGDRQKGALSKRSDKTPKKGPVVGGAEVTKSQWEWPWDRPTAMGGTGPGFSG